MFIGNGICQKAKELINYGVDRVFVYDYEPLKYYRVDVYADVFENCINRVKPSIILVGATSVGRSLAPRLSARFRTGLTADCTKLEVKENTDLVQIRPAFGGNIMAQIITTNSRPQFATVRYKVMDTAERIKDLSGVVEECHFDEDLLRSNIKVIKVVHKQKLPSISDAEVLVVAGREEYLGKKFPDKSSDAYLLLTFDGNLHIYVCRDGLETGEWRQKLDALMKVKYEKANELDGQVSGEHGIGHAKIQYLKESIGDEYMLLMKSIKNVFDPQNILNPGKVCL